MALERAFSYFERAFFQQIAIGKNSVKSGYFEEDRISQLPDDVLTVILSHMTVKDCFKTRVLSRRWRHLKLSHLHASKSELNFDFAWAGLDFTPPIAHECQKHARAFVQDVNKFLDQYKGPNISSFAVGFCLSRKFSSDIDRWITYPVKLGVEQLKISCRCVGISKCKQDEFYSFSFRLLSEAYELKRLELDSCILKPDLNGQFHSLKFLKLTRTALDQSMLLFILSRFCNLEELSLRVCFCPAVLSFCAPFLKLKKLDVYFCKGLEEIELSTTSLTSLILITDSYNFNIVFSSVPNLKNLLCSMPYTTSFPVDLFNKIENAAPQLQYLSVASQVKMMQTIPSSVATFHNLKHAEFFLCADTSPYDIRKIITVIGACPLLEIFNLSIKQGLYLGNARNLEIRTMTEIPNRSLPHLKKVELAGFQATETQLELALYLLKNAIALEGMVITPCQRIYVVDSGVFTHEEYPTEPWSENMRRRIVERLQGESASKSAQLSIYDGFKTILPDNKEFFIQPLE